MQRAWPYGCALLLSQLISDDCANGNGAPTRKLGAQPPPCRGMNFADSAGTTTQLRAAGKFAALIASTCLPKPSIEPFGPPRFDHSVTNYMLYLASPNRLLRAPSAQTPSDTSGSAGLSVAMVRFSRPESVTAVRPLVHSDCWLASSETCQY